MSIIAIISDLSTTSQHALNCKAALIAGSGGLIASENVTILDGGLVPGYGGGIMDDIESARLLGAILLSRSTTGSPAYSSYVSEYYVNHGILTVMPAGSNSPGEIFDSVGGTQLPVIVITGAGDTGNETADDVEFIADDPITTETGGSDDVSSFSNPYIAAQLYQIKVGRACGWWEARYAARMTGSEGGVWDEVNGFGFIDVSAAIAYAGTIIADPYSLAVVPPIVIPPIVIPPIVIPPIVIPPIVIPPISEPIGDIPLSQCIYTALTRTISNASMSEDLTQADVGSVIHFTTEDSEYHSIIATVTGVDSLTLVLTDNLPIGNANIVSLTVDSVVVDDNPSAIVPLADIKVFLKIPTTDLTLDSTLQDWINKESLSIECYIDNKVKAQTITNELRDGNGRMKIRPAFYPVVSVTTVEQYVDSVWNDIETDSDNIIFNNPLLGFASEQNSYNLELLKETFTTGRRNIRLTYVAGYSTVPQDLYDVCFERVLDKYFKSKIGESRFGVDSVSRSEGGGSTSTRYTDFTKKHQEMMKPFVRTQV